MYIRVGIINVPGPVLTFTFGCMVHRFINFQYWFDYYKTEGRNCLYRSFPYFLIFWILKESPGTVCIGGRRTGVEGKGGGWGRCRSRTRVCTSTGPIVLFRAMYWRGRGCLSMVSRGGGRILLLPIPFLQKHTGGSSSGKLQNRWVTY